MPSKGSTSRTITTHADEGSRDRLYLRYGYFMGLKSALAVLTNRGQTLH